MTVLWQRNFGLLWWAGLISMLGNWMLRIALPITVYELTGSAAALAATTAAGFVPALLIGPFAGVLVDRWDRRHVMIWANLAQAVILLPLLLVDDASRVWIVVAVSLASQSVGQFSQLAENALLPRVVTAGHLAAANSLNAVNNNLARFLGPLAGGSVAVWAGLGGVVWFDMATYLLAAALVVMVTGRHTAEPDPGEPATRGLWRQLRQGFDIVVHNRLLWVLTGFIAVSQLGEGVFSTLYVVFVAEELGGGSQVYGWLNAAQAVGGVLGGLAGGVIAARLSPRVVLGGGIICFGLIDLAIFNYPQWYPHVPPAIALMVLVGVPASVSMAAWLTMVQQAVPDRLRGRVLSLITTVMSVSLLAGTAIAGFTAGRLDVVTVLNIQGATAILSGIGALLLLKAAFRHPSSKPVERPEVAPVA
ncbi:Na+/melibiose symporter-like transporter [Stackebrandtia albiflava]|uniref:Na+/melibiose symporter-like transporter n=1 Tax=Stackebrandtia albiflava TaxID=406432 RepID=A0A562V4W7_9ACTN|nr:MFS transporter [Stackebrandtia albiflava]TWJ12941.1 Na+/melibiose symporter-like transporter [Stackebrandtia albiflava]